MTRRFICHIILFLKDLLPLLFFCIPTVSSATFSPQQEKTEILKLASRLLQTKSRDTLKVHILTGKIDSLLQRQMIGDKDFAFIIRQTGETFREKGGHSYAIELFMKATAYYEQLKEPTKEQIQYTVGQYISLGASHEELGMWSQAMDFNIKALALAESYKLEPQKAMLYNNIGAIQYQRGEYEKAENYLLRALAINQRLSQKKELFNNYNNLAGVYAQQQKIDKALDYAFHALQQLDSKGDADLYYFMQTNIANLYMKKKDYALAIGCIRNAMYQQELRSLDYDVIQTYLLLSHAYEAVNRADSVYFYLQKALILARHIQNRHLESDILSNLAFFYQKQNSYKRAYETLYLSNHIADSISAIDNRNKMDNLEIIYNIEKKQRENELQLQEIKLRKLNSDRLWISMLSFSVLLLFTLLYLLAHFRNKEKVRKAQLLLEEQQLTLHEKEKELLTQKEKDLRNLIDQKNRELTSYTLHLIRNNEFIANLTAELKQVLLELNPRDTERRKRIREILMTIHRQNTHNNWEEFKYYFEQVHLSFYDNLGNRYPELTLKDKRLCAFLRLGLSTKEISAITFKEVRSVESARNRLRKKLNINPEENLIDFLSQFSISN